MFPFPISHFAAGGIPPTVEFIRTKVNVKNLSDITDTAVPIGDAYDERWVVFCVHAGSNSVGIGNLTATIGGVAATRLLERHNGVGDGGAAMFIRKVSTGTTVTCAATVDSGYFHFGGGSTYVLRDIKSEIPESSFIDTDYGTSYSGSLNVSKKSVVIADVAGWTNVASTWAWSGSLGVTEQFDEVICTQANSLRGTGAITTATATGSKTVTATSSIAMSSANAEADLLAASWE